MKTHKHKASRKYAAIEKGAAMRGIEFDITFQEYRKVYFEKPCYYCGITAIGLDRICSVDGYNSSNVVACCVICNMMKGVLERDAFLTHCKRITLLHEIGGMPSVETLQRDVIEEALVRTGNNQSLAAKELGIPRTTLRNQMQKLGISKVGKP